ncbi:MAG: phosphate ABC transporter permease subunit PstC [Opitutales bacterium]
MQQTPESPKPTFGKRRAFVFGKDSDSVIKGFFGSSATVSIIILGLITLFLFKEGLGFVNQYYKSLQKHRLSGIEYVEILREQHDAYTELNRYVIDIKADWINKLRAQDLTSEEIQERVTQQAAEGLFSGYANAGSELASFVREKMEAAIAIRDQKTTNENWEETLDNYAKRIETVSKPGYDMRDSDRAKYALRLNEYANSAAHNDPNADVFRSRALEVQSGAPMNKEDRERFLTLLQEEFDSIQDGIQTVDFDERVKAVTDHQGEYAQILGRLETNLRTSFEHAARIDFNNTAIEQRVATLQELNELYFSGFAKHGEKLANWDSAQPIPVWQALRSFLSGREWITASDQQDWYGLLPLLTGSILVSIIAIAIAVPFGVGAAIYVNQIAGPKERNVIKPFIEFISAIPSVVLGFFGVMVFGEALRILSQLDVLGWVPFFPLQERLNAFTAGCLLALMAIPTIFTLAEEAINNVPKHFKEASLAMGATSIQTTLQIVVPTAFSGIISAVMLGFGRVIGETMVVLLCAGNRIKIPDFTEGLGIFVEPVHTMTGIIAQEMGEVVHSSLHYRALFMVGIILFFISLVVNFGAQRVVKRFNRVKP